MCHLTGCVMTSYKDISEYIHKYSVCVCVSEIRHYVMNPSELFILVTNRKEE